MDKYFVVTVIREFEDGPFYSVKNTKELAELWQCNDDTGAYDEIIAYKYDVDNGEMVKVNVYDIASAYLSEREEMQREYEEYTETVNEYGYDYVPDYETV